MSTPFRSATAVASRGSDFLPRLVQPVAAVVLRRDLPNLPGDRREQVASFVGDRCNGLPSVMRIGVILIAGIYRLVLAAPGGERVVHALAARPLPLLGEYPRLIRSLGFAMVWESWPSTLPDGSQR